METGNITDIAERILTISNGKKNKKETIRLKRAKMSFSVLTNFYFVVRIKVKFDNNGGHNL